MNAPAKVKQHVKSRTIEIFLFADALALDIAGPLEVFNTASKLLEKQCRGGRAYNLVFSAAKCGLITLCSGLKLHAEAELGECEPPDTLLIPGGEGVGRVTEIPELLSRIKSEAKRAGRVVSVCNGAFILAACGLLKGKRATTHWMVAEELARRLQEKAIFGGFLTTSLVRSLTLSGRILR